MFDKNQYILDEIQIAHEVIAKHDKEEANDTYRNAYVIGVLRATLASMAGLGKHALHRSCFDEQTTQAVRQLIETIDQQ